MMINNQMLKEFSSFKEHKASLLFWKSPPLIPILRQTDQVDFMPRPVTPRHATPSHYIFTFSLSYYPSIYLGLPNGLFPSGFPTKIL
jgi:hypothetical protein